MAGMADAAAMELASSAPEPPAALASAVPAAPTTKYKLCVLTPTESRAGVCLIKQEFIKPRPASDAADVAVGSKREGSALKDKRPSKRAKLKEARNTRRRDICHNAAIGNVCPYGDGCQYSHDVAAYLLTKPPDLGPTCYNFVSRGRCPYGATCCFASGHFVDGVNLVNEEVQKQYVESTNLLSKELRGQIRQGSYPFEKAEAIKNILCPQAAKPAAAPAAPPTDPCPPPTDTLTAPAATATEPSCEGADYVETRLRPAERRKVDFTGKLYLAPLTTVGNLPYRRICKRLGADITCGEMALSSNLLQAQPSEWALLRRHPCEDVFGVQICGSNVEQMVKCAQLVEEQCSIDFVDINAGCPIDIICKRGAGSAMLDKPKRIQNIVTGMSQMLSCPLTIKMRTGKDEKCPTLHSIVPQLQGWGAQALTIHGRSRLQRYSRLADWEYIGRCAALTPIPVIGNGDILTWEEAVRLQESTHVSSLMLARGALIKPWLFTEIKERRHWDISSGERLDILRDFTNFSLEHYGSDAQGVFKARTMLLEWLSFLHRYVPVGLLEVLPQRINGRPPCFFGRNDLETLMASDNVADWIQISSMLLGPPAEGFTFVPKHRSNSYEAEASNG
eukprot:gnl/Hemi2/24330_TR8177_c0_g1_i1.p1 gnl/Hemi2/24330_TR8177_c0_g1~~gnl/Hemi2/24330_TR8177_c0_g1_i1.p1  ORF type:complete len:619 (-),score=180.01 gnl/Hemi2/24330_TR8177_c0_g1_i1:130-1986(-)